MLFPNKLSACSSVVLFLTRSVAADSVIVCKLKISQK